MRKIENIGFAGLGLIGGTIARAIRNVYPDSLICAYDPDLAALREARFDGVIDRALGSVEELASCDLIFFCAPVALNCENMAALAPFVKEEMILTDVSSVKGSIHKAVRGLGLSGHFIGGHPMTGSERTGYRNSDPALLENAYYLLAPEPEFPEEATVWMNDFIRSLGALPLTVSCEEHDFATAAISHVPHVIAASLVNLVRDSDNPDEIMHTIAAGGFKQAAKLLQGAFRGGLLGAEAVGVQTDQHRPVDDMLFHKYLKSDSISNFSGRSQGEWMTKARTCLRCGPRSIISGRISC